MGHILPAGAGSHPAVGDNLAVEVGNPVGAGILAEVGPAVDTAGVEHHPDQVVGRLEVVHLVLQILNIIKTNVNGLKEKY